jgi:hypothetical protein
MVAPLDAMDLLQLRATVAAVNAELSAGDAAARFSLAPANV